MFQKVHKACFGRFLEQFISKPLLQMIKLPF